MIKQKKKNRRSRRKKVHKKNNESFNLFRCILKFMKYVKFKDRKNSACYFLKRTFIFFIFSHLRNLLTLFFSFLFENYSSLQK